MVKPKEIICDKCGAEIDYYWQKNMSVKILLWGIGVNRYNEGQRIDLCEECFQEFIQMYDKFIGS